MKNNEQIWRRVGDVEHKLLFDVMESRKLRAYVPRCAACGRRPACV